MPFWLPCSALPCLALPCPAVPFLCAHKSICSAILLCRTVFASWKIFTKISLLGPLSNYITWPGLRQNAQFLSLIHPNLADWCLLSRHLLSWFFFFVLSIPLSWSAKFTSLTYLTLATSIFTHFVWISMTVLSYTPARMWDCMICEPTYVVMRLSRRWNFFHSLCHTLVRKTLWYVIITTRAQ